MKASTARPAPAQGAASPRTSPAPRPRATTSSPAAVQIPPFTGVLFRALRELAQRFRRGGRLPRDGAAARAVVLVGAALVALVKMLDAWGTPEGDRLQEAVGALDRATGQIAAPHTEPEPEEPASPSTLPSPRALAALDAPKPASSPAEANAFALPPPFQAPFFQAVANLAARAKALGEPDQSTPPTPQERATEAIYLTLLAVVAMMQRWGSAEAEQVTEGAYDLNRIAHPEQGGFAPEVIMPRRPGAARAAAEAPAPTVASPRSAPRADQGVANEIGRVRPVKVNACNVPEIERADLGQLLAHALCGGGGNGEPVQWGIIGAADDLEVWRAFVSADEFDMSRKHVLVNSIAQLQARLVVLAELHRRQIAARAPRVAA